MDRHDTGAPVDRRAFLRRAGAAGTLAAAGLAGCTTSTGGGGGAVTTDADATGSTDGTGTGTDGGGSGSFGPDRLAVEPVATGFDSPVAVEAPAGAGGRLYVVDQGGTVTVLGGDGGSRSTFLDVSDRLADGLGTEMGLLGLAIHPEFPDVDRVYVRYSAPLRDRMPDGYSHTFVLSEFRATAGSADPESERVLLEVAEPQPNHNAGSVAFGPDGLLYVGVGDGGGGGDRGTGHVDDWYDAVPGGNGQDVSANLLGSVLRIDPLGGTAGTSDGGRGNTTGSAGAGGTSGANGTSGAGGDGGDRPYGIPDDNPLVGREGLDEQYAWGFRNPWRFSWDRETGDFLVADVGQSEYEEVSRVAAGGNYGWNVYEGFEPYGAEEAPSETPDGEPLLEPVLAYPHSGDAVSGVSVIGGYVYRGGGIPELGGRYVFGDWRPGGDLFLAEPRASGRWPTRAVPTEGLGRSLLSFGEGPDGTLYVCTVGDGGGQVGRLVPA